MWVIVQDYITCIAPFIAVKSREGKLTFCFEAFQHSRDSICKWGRGDLPKLMKNVASTLVLMEALPPPPPQLSLLHECIQSHVRMTHTSHSWAKGNMCSNACHSVPSTAGVFLFTLILHSSAKLVHLRESDVHLIPFSFHVSVCFQPLLSCWQCTSWFSQH